MRAPLSYGLDPRRTALTLGWIAFGLLVLHMAAAYAWVHDGPRYVGKLAYVEMLDLDEEAGFGTWYAAVTLLLAGRILLVVARDSRRAREGLWGWWFGLGIGFHVLSIDEVAGMHEYFNAYGALFFGADAGWTEYALYVVGLVALSYLPFLRRLGACRRPRTPILLVVAGALYVGGAVIVEKISPEPGGPVSLNSMVYNVGWITLEEGLEMAGVIVLIYALLDHLRGGAGRELRAVVASEEAG